MNEAADMGLMSAARASGIWFATVLSIGFVLTQADGFNFGMPIIIALAFWIPVGILVDLWSRSRTNSRAI